MICSARLRAAGLVDPRAPPERTLVLVPERSVLPDREREDEAFLLPVLGDVADAEGAVAAGSTIR